MSNLILQSVKSGPDGHGLDVTLPVDAVVITARLAQRLIEPPLQLLDPHHHVQVALGVLLDHVADVVGLSRLLELSPGHEVFDLADGSNGVFVRISQTAKILTTNFPGNRNLIKSPQQQIYE